MSPTGSALLALWIGAARAEDPPAPPDPDEMPTAAGPVVTREPHAAAALPVPRVVLGANFGAALPLRALGPSAAPGLEAGVVVDAGGRFTALLDIGYAGGHAEGAGTDPAFPDGYTWTLDLAAMQIAPGLRVRLLPWAERIAPEVAAGPLLVIGDAVAGGAAGGTPFPETREARVAPGGFVAGGLAGRVGPGMLEGRVTFSLLHFDGALTGDAWVPAITPAIGYRVAR